MIEKFENLQQFESSVKTLDQAEALPVYIKDKVNENYKAVWNKSKDQLEGIIPAKYGLIEHEQAFGPFIKVLEGKSMEGVKGVIKNFGGYVVVEAILPGLTVEVKNGDTINLGVRLSNNYGAQTNKPMFRGEAFGYRSVCQNGMFFGQVMVSKFFASHEKVADLEKQLLDFVGNVMENSQVIKSILVNNTKDEMSLKEAKEIVKGEIGRKKALVLITGYLGRNDKVTKYDLYNAITQYATFNVRNEKQRVQVQTIAQKVLVKSRDKLRKAVLEKEDLEE
jgi:hypothetical protein